MSVLAEKSKIVNFRTDPLLAEEAKQIIEEQGLTMTKALQLFLKNVVASQKVDLLSEEELEREKLLRELQQEIQDSIANYEAGNYLTEDEVRGRFGI